MIAPKLKDGDLVIENNELILIDGDEELAQSIRSALQTRKGEFFLEPEHGLVFDNLIGKAANQDEARDDIIEATSQEPQVSSVTDIVFTDDRKTRKRAVNLTIEKEDGTQIPVGEVPFNA